ncbi:complex I subunit 5 family protein [Geomonas sp.]|uniref:complex I subunit 5 family protein n=1 Tax=Geomonas sp. TaxID=2651584 RepID=UPI002B46C3B7|nr:proton-conducting transporter membrane subunit [Geomonas sp.]HJV33860.1 proton-conducting transporter membrane subunit [Geomonas sp.]
MPPLPVVIPLVMAAILVALEKIPGNHRLLDFLSVATALVVLCIDLVLFEASLTETIVYWFGGWSPMGGFPIGIAFVIDPAGAALAALAALLTVMGLLFSWHYFRAIGTFYHSLMLLFLASMEGFTLTGDLFNMFVFFELMGVAAYALTGYKIEDTGPLEGALNFSVMNSIGAFLVLFGIGLIYGRTGGLNLAWAGNFLELHGADRTLVVAFLLLAIGFLVKAAIVPFHFWLPDAHAVAPTPASMLFSGIMVELGLYAVARIYWSVLSSSLQFLPLRDLFVSIGLATAITGAVLACMQRHMKRLLAYSTVSHSGMMLAGIALLDSSSLGGVLLYIVAHGMIKGGLFIGTGIILYHFSSIDEERLRGKCCTLRFIGVLFCLSGLALAGMPPFGTGAGKGIIEKSALALGYGSLSSIFLVCSAVTGGAVLRAGASVFFGLGTSNFISDSAPTSGDREPPETTAESGRTPLMMWLPFLLLACGGVAVGAIPRAAGLATEAALRFTDGAGYRATVLKGIAIHPLPATAPHIEWKGGAEAAVLALAVAALFLFRTPLPTKMVKSLKGLVKPVLSWLRAIHSGYIGDYVTWFMIGAGIMAVITIIR